MARYTGPKTKVSRRYGVLVHGSPKAFENKNYPPGQHGPKGSRRKLSDYALALDGNQPCARCRPSALRSPLSATSRQSPTTAVVLPNSEESNKFYV